MSFQISKVDFTVEFDDIWDVIFDAFDTPHNPLFKFLHPIHTTRYDAIRVSKNRYVHIWLKQEGYHWIKATEKESGKVVRAACWTLYPEGQRDHPELPPIEASWLIEGSEEKAFAEKLFNGISKAVSHRVQVPHFGKSSLPVLGSILTFTGLSHLVVHPKYRLQGAACMLIEWGTSRATELGIDSIFITVPYAERACERCGFGVIEQIDVNFTIPDPSEKWKELENDNPRVYIMWKPAGRVYTAEDPGLKALGL